MKPPVIPSSGYPLLRSILFLLAPFFIIRIANAQDNLPIADAGPYQTNVGFGAQVELDGANSQSQSGGTLSYTWEQIFGAPVTLEAADTASPSFTSPSVNDILDPKDKERFQIVAISPDRAKLAFKLTVTDSNGLSASDEAIVTLTESFSSGLKNVALGARVYFNAALRASYAWSLIAPKRSHAELSDDDSRNPNFSPEVIGRYTVVENNTRKSITMNVGKWVGVGEVNPLTPSFPECAQCHSAFGISDIITPWSLTNHATIFQRAIDGHASSRFPTSPLSHFLSISTVGYDGSSTADNNGFDELARDLDWTFPTVLQPGNFDAMPQALRGLANVQCENCHGPGSEHNGSPERIGVSFRVGVCAQCHARFPDDPTFFEWSRSRHAHPDSGGFLEVQPIGTGDATSVACAVCHDPHPRSGANDHLLRFFGNVELASGVTFAADVSAVCVKCHTDNDAQPGSVPEHPQAEMLAGVGGFEYPGETYLNGSHTSSIHRKCVGCHGAPTPDGDGQHEVGGHTFKMRFDNGTSFNTGDDVLHVESCSRCHGGITSFDFAGTQTRVQDLLDELESLLPARPTVLIAANIGRPNLPGAIPQQVEASSGTLTEPEMNAAFNWFFVENDGSLGVHNHRYAEKLLSDSIAALKAIQNRPPVADAGADTVVFVGDKVKLDGSESFDPEGAEISWAWRFASIPDDSSAVLGDSDSVSASFTPDAAGDYVVELIVSDSEEESTPDKVTITAQSAADTGIILQSPSDNATVSFSSPLVFHWTSRGVFKSFIVEASSSPDFAKGKSKVYRMRVLKGATSLAVRNPQLERIVRVAKSAPGGSSGDARFTGYDSPLTRGLSIENRRSRIGDRIVYWRVRGKAKGKAKGKAVSLSDVFKLNIPPPSLVPLTPPDTAVIYQSRITFNWDAVGVDRFRIEFSIDPSFRKGRDTATVNVRSGNKQEPIPTSLTVGGSAFKKVVRLAEDDNDRLFWRVAGRVIGDRDWITSSAFTFSLSGALFESDYVGSTTCKLCHEDIYDSWRETSHSRSLRDIVSTNSPDYQDPTDPRFGVLGTFDGPVTLSDPESGVPSVQITLNGDGYNFAALRGDQLLTIIRTYGGGNGWRQNYITQIGLSHYVLPFQWDEGGEGKNGKTRQRDNEIRISASARRATGRRDFGLRISDLRTQRSEKVRKWDAPPSHFLTSSPQGWAPFRLSDWFDEEGNDLLPLQERSFEVTCAGCHHTGLNISQDKKTGDFVATYSELNIGCEACHGPGGEHFRTANPASIINPRELSRQRANEVCGQCHSRGVSTGTVGGAHLDYPWNRTRGRFVPGRKLSDYLTDRSVDWPDGTARLNYQQFQDYVVGAHGLGRSTDSPTCFVCHDPHGSANEHDITTTVNGLPTRVEDNSLCLSCHGFPGSGFETAEEISAHTRHAYDPEATGRSRCTLCHAPAVQKSATEYDLHGHKFYVLAPAKTLEFQAEGGMPNSCAVSCHRALANDDPSRAGHGDTLLAKWDEPTDVELAEYLDEFFRAWWVASDGK